MIRYLSASKVKAPAHTNSEYIDADFMCKYMRKFNMTSVKSEKIDQILADMYDTANRICNDDVIQQESKTTCWTHSDVLWFDPSRVDTTCITEEQKASFYVMHEPETSRIKVVVDFSKITFWSALRVSRRASYHNIVDGMRLWSTLPYSIDTVYFISPSDSSLISILTKVMPKFLSEKMQKKIRVLSSEKEVKDTINELALKNSGDCPGDDMCNLRGV